MTLAYFAGRRMKVGTEFRDAGQPVPEAPSFPTLRELCETGELLTYTDESDDKGHVHAGHPVTHGFNYNPYDVVFDASKVAEYNESAARLPEPVTAVNKAFPPAPVVAAPETVETVPTGSWDVRNKGVAATVSYTREHPEDIDRLIADEQASRNRAALIQQLEDLRR